MGKKLHFISSLFACINKPELKNFTANNEEESDGAPVHKNRFRIIVNINNLGIMNICCDFVLDKEMIEKNINIKTGKKF